MDQHPDGHQDRPGVLPPSASAYIREVVAGIRYRRRVRQDVEAELTAHFEDALKSIATETERDQKARELIKQFGDPQLLAVLCRRAKRRCRPLWQKALVRAAQTLGVILLYLVICSMRLLIGTPRVTTDYVARLSDQVSQGKAPSLNARPYLDEAARLAEGEPHIPEGLLRGGSWWPGDMSETRRQAVAELLEASTEAFDALSQGVTKPYCWTDYMPQAATEPGSSTDEPTSLSMANTSFAPTAGNLILPRINSGIWSSLVGYKSLARKVALRAQWRAWRGDLEGACEDCLMLQGLGWYLEGHGLMAEQLVGTAIEGLSHGTCLTILDRADIPPNLLQHVQTRLEKRFCRREAVLSFAADRLFWYDQIQRTFTDDGNGSGRPLKPALPLVAADWGDSLVGLVTFGYPSRREMIHVIDRFYDQMEAWRAQAPWQVDPDAQADELSEIAADSFLLRIQAPPYARLGSLVWRLETGRRVLLVILAALRYEKDNGAYPESLDTLSAEGYLSEIPIDPYSGRPLVYRRTPEGFVLYSWGANLTDEGGRQGTGRGGQPRLWQEDGDWVFWPVQRDANDRDE